MVKTLTKPDQIQAYLLKYFHLAPEQYEIHDDHSVTVKDEVMCPSSQLRSLQVKFRTVQGDFHLHCSSLQTLHNMPEQIQGDLTIRGGKFTSMEGAPHTVTGSVDLLGCKQLASLQGFPSQTGGINIDGAAINSSQLKYLPRHVPGRLYINRCLNIFDLHGLPTRIDRDLDLRLCPISSLDGFEGCGGQLVVDYSPQMPLLKSLMAKDGVMLVNRGGYTAGMFIIDTREITEELNKFKGQGKVALLNAALALKKLGEKYLPSAGTNPFLKNAKW